MARSSSPLLTATAISVAMTVSTAAAPSRTRNVRGPRRRGSGLVGAAACLCEADGGSWSASEAATLRSLSASASIIVAVESLPDHPGSDCIRGVVPARLDALQDVDHDDRHVVAAAVAIRCGDEPLRGGLRIRVGDRNGGDLVVVDLVDQAVAAQDEAVAVDDRQEPRVDPHRRLDAEGAGDDVAARVRARLGSVMWPVATSSCT